MAFQVTEVQKALKGADYPMDGKALSALAKKNGADGDLVDALQGLREVDGPNTVMQELKGSLGGPTPGGKRPGPDAAQGRPTARVPGDGGAEGAEGRRLPSGREGALRTGEEERRRRASSTRCGGARAPCPNRVIRLKTALGGKPA